MYRIHKVIIKVNFECKSQLFARVKNSCIWTSEIWPSFDHLKSTNSGGVILTVQFNFIRFGVFLSHFWENSKGTIMRETLCMCVCVCGMDPLGPLWLPCKWASLLRNCSPSKREERWGQQRRGWKFWFCWCSIVLQRKGGLWFTVITGIRSLKSFSLSLSGSVLLSFAPFQRK